MLAAAAAMLVAVSCASAAQVEIKAQEGSGRKPSEAVYMNGSNADVLFDLPADMTATSVSSGGKTLLSAYWSQSGNVLTIKSAYMGVQTAGGEFLLELKVAMKDASDVQHEGECQILVRSTNRWHIAVKTPDLKTSNPSIDLSLSESRPIELELGELAKRTALPQTSFITGNDKSDMGAGYEGGWGLSYDTIVKYFGDPNNMHSMQCVYGSTKVSGDILAIAYSVRGSDLVNISNGPVSARETKVLKLLAGGKTKALSFATTATDFKDGNFAIFSAAEAAKSGAVSLGADDKVQIGSSYVLVVFIRDGGELDLDPETGHRVVDPIVVQKVKQPNPSSSGGGGCSSFGAPLIAMLAAVCLSRRR